MSLRFLLDEDISFRVAEEARRQGLDVISVAEVGRGNRRISDEGQLAFAASEGRVLVTYNRADYQALDGQWRLQGRTHAGILWCVEKTLPRRAIGDLIRALATVANNNEWLEGLCLPLQRTLR